MYTEEGLALRRKRPWRHATAAHCEQRRPATAINDIWSMDFVADELTDGRRFRTLTVLDLFTRGCLDIAVGRGLTGQDVAATLERLRFDRGLPERIYCDNGSEFVGATMDLWAYTNKDILDFSRRGKPTDNAAIESFNGRFRDECLNVHWFESLEDASTKPRRGDRTTMRIILTERSRASVPMNTLGKRWNPLQSHSDFGPKHPVLSSTEALN